MRPFQQFRLWARRAPVAERAGAAGVAVLAGSLGSWLLVSPPHPPSSSSTNVEASSGGVAAGDATADTATSVPNGSPVGVPGSDGGTATGTGGSSASASSGSSSTGGGGCVSPPGTDQGITDKEVRIALILVDIAGPAANNTFNVPSAAAQKADYQAVVDDINAHGGVVCRKLVPVWFTINPLDQSNLQQTCLDIAEAKLFYVNDLGGYAAFP